MITTRLTYIWLSNLSILAYLMKVISETRSAQYIWYLRLLLLSGALRRYLCW